MTKAQQAVLFLVRAGIGFIDEPCFDFDGLDWNELYALSMRQGVSAVAYDGLASLYDKLPDLYLEIDSEQNAALKHAWVGNCLSMEAGYARYEATVRELITLCREHGADVLLLKGYGLSKCYPIPSHRPCGDIDVFLFGDSEKLDSYVEQSLNESVKRNGMHHTAFVFNGITVENHKTLMDVVRHKNHKLDEKVFEGLISAGCEEIGVLDQKCHIPSVKLNSIYLLRHMAHHFSVDRITVRHLLDWALFVNANSLRIDWNYVWDYAGRTGCAEFLNCLNGICVSALGFDPSMFPIKNRTTEMQGRMLADILTPEFNSKMPPRQKKIRYGIAKTHRLWANRWKYKMVSNERLTTTFWSLVQNRLHN